MAKQKNQVKKYRKPINLNIGMIIFAVIFFYMIYCVIAYFQSNHIVRYEVKEGSIAVNNICRGIILRDETVLNVEKAGYVNYFTYEGERVAKGDLVYTLDETGRVNQQIQELHMEENTLSDKELREFRSEIVNFTHDFQGEQYQKTYEFKHSLQNTLAKLENSNMLKMIQDINQGNEITNVVSYGKAPVSGIIALWTDGYENLNASEVTESILQNKTYEKQLILNNKLVAEQDIACKISTNENWSIVVPIEAERGKELEEKGYVKVKFLKNQYESWASVKLLYNQDGNNYLELSFTNSMITFIGDRFVDVELIVNDEKGLKIPVSSIVEKEFFLVNQDFITEGTSRGKYNVIRQKYLEDGTISSESLTIDVYSYNENDKEYYVDATILNPGDILLKQNGQDTYPISKRATLIGVYNMNKGYADFKQISILYENDEYAIVKANTNYGLNVYDYIVLNAKTVKDDQFIK